MAATPLEVEFASEKELIEVVPNFNMQYMYFISGTLGPFKAGVPIRVPIWLAVSLQSRKKCDILTPRWMNVANLERIKKEEITSPHFVKMPSEHYMAVAKILFDSCPADMVRADEVKTLIKVGLQIMGIKLQLSLDRCCPCPMPKLI